MPITAAEMPEMSNNHVLRAVWFRVIPFWKKMTGPTRDGTLNQLDWDALGDKARRPVIQEAVYTPIPVEFDAAGKLDGKRPPAAVNLS